eukprot:TRINITY_DN13182_c0_g1_i1.p1 TRINITY_DN13182_c0_g1~~TRINITY_DN13182_c0_g1_i1.p1  ORF type:complete len:1050 (+),score=253.50 TRINITY_DN13182_c0_g1_i1:21-3170(+)
MEVEDVVGGTKRKRSPSPVTSDKRAKVEDTETVVDDVEAQEIEEVPVDDTGVYWQDNWLPEDVLYLIMYRLARVDLVACRMTCKQWQKVSEDERLNWLALTYYAVAKSDYNSWVSSVQADEATYLSILQEVGKDDPEFKDCEFTIEHVNVEHLSMFYRRYRPETQQVRILLKNKKYSTPVKVGDAVFHSSPFYTFSKFLESIESRPRDLFKLDVTPSISEGLFISFTLTLHVNVWRFERKVKGGETFDDQEREFFYNVMIQDFENFFLKFSGYTYVDTSIPEVTLTRKKPENLVDTVKLHSYQLDALSWMMHVEDSVDTDYKFCTLASWGGAQADVLFDLSRHTDAETKPNRKFFTISDVQNFTKVTKFRGGVLADEMGLGKTLEVISLIATRKFEDTAKIATKTGSYIVSKATFINCPNHLCSQWASEIAKFAPTLKVCVITTVKQYRSYTTRDLCEADVVLCSFQFLVNKNYIGGHNGKADLANLDKHGTPLNKFKWHRVILDEGHEIISGVDAKKTYPTKHSVPIQKYQASFYWFVSGTPFPSIDVVEGVLRFLIGEQAYQEIVNYLVPLDQAFPLHKYIVWVLSDILLNNLYWRNTKDNVQEDEFTIPDCKTELVLIDFHEVERALYNDAENKAEQLSICQDPFHSMPDSNMEALRAASLATRQHQLRSTKESIKYHKQQVALWEDRLANSPNASAEQLLTMKRNKMTNENKIPALKRRKVILIGKVKMWEAVTPVVNPSPVFAVATEEKSSQEEEEEKPKEKELAPEKHIEDMTVAELQAQLRKKKMPVSGTKKVLLKRLRDVIEEEEEEAEDFSDECVVTGGLSLERLIFIQGSKIAHALTNLRNLWKKEPDAKVIIFSKYTWLLSRMGELLAQEGVASVVVEGNVHRRNKAIHAFSKNVKVILLGLKSAASGTNLTQATHIVLMDPMQGTAKEIRATEAQAIARAYRQGQERKVTIVRFLIKDTIEHETYLEVYGTPEEEKTEDELNLTVSSDKLRSSRAQMIRTTSDLTKLLNSPGLQRAGSFLLGELVEGDKGGDSDAEH